MEKLIKAINSTKQFYGPDNSDAAPKKDGLLMPTKSERQENCKIIVECILSSSVKTNTEYPGLLGITLETLLQACQDSEADVRIAAEESLNRIIKSTDELLFGKVHLEFYKEIKRNGPGRSLRAALVRFASMAHKIRPNKCRPYVVSLLPALIRICQRQDENIQECLALSVAKIFPHLGSFAAEGELQVFIDALLVNLSSTSATIRRTAASCIYEVVKNTRKKEAILSTVSSKILSITTSNLSDVNSTLGAIVTLRYLVPLMDNPLSDRTEKPRTGSFGSDKDATEKVSACSHVMKIFEVCCHSLCHSDANIVTASLETLQTLLKLPCSALGNILKAGKLDKTVFSEQLASQYDSILLKGDRVTESLVESTPASSTTPEISSESPYRIRGLHPQTSSEPPLSSSSVEVQDFRQVPEEEELQLENEEEDITSKLNNIILSAGDSEDAKHVPETHNEGGEVPIDGNAPKSFDEVDSSPRLVLHECDEPHELSESAPEHSTTTTGRDENSVPSHRTYVNNVSRLYSEDNPLTVVAKMLCERILKVGFENKKTNVRVSVKNLALSCLGLIIKLKPKIMFSPVLGNDSSLSSGHVLDALSYKTFYDPQIRGTAVMLVSRFITSALIESKNDYDAWLPNNLQIGARAVTSVERLVSVILSGLTDSSLVCIRASISAVSQCINELLNSPFVYLGLKLLNRVLDLKDTSYWLLKVDILEIFSSVSFAQIVFVAEAVQDVTQNHTFLLVNKLKNDVFKVGVDYLSDRDARVRKAASGMFVSLVSNSGSFIDSRRCDMTTSHAAKLCQTFNVSTAAPSVSVPGQRGEEKNLLKVHRGYEKLDGNNLIGHTLSCMVNKITSLLSASTSKHLTQGCIHALLSICDAYAVSKYPSSYGCDFTHIDTPFQENGTEAALMQNSGILSTLISMLESSWLAAEITTHGDVLMLAGNYVAGISFHGFEVVGPNPKISEQESLLPQKGSSGQGEGAKTCASILDPTIAAYVSKVFCHILKLISIFHHVIADALPTVPNKSVLQTLQTTPSITSSLKKRDKSDSKDSMSSTETNTHKKTGSLTKAQDVKDEPDKEKQTKSSHNSPFSFAHSRVYMKMYELLVGAYETYKVTVEVDDGDRFGSLLQAVLDVFSQILEITTFEDIEKHTEEILSYLKTIFAVEPTLTVQAVQQLLKALFGTNFVSQIDLSDWVKPKSGQNLGKDSQQGQASLYHQVFHHPLNDLTMAIANASFHHYLQSENAPKAGTGWFGSIKKKVEKKLTMTAKRSKGDKTSVQNYIRLFETIVIKSLKNYTMSSSVRFQKNVLNLLAQLVQLRVNYCLLDSDQIFIGFLIKQFEAIEGGLVKNSDVLIPHMFFFLVLLSYEKHHSKSVITMPKIIQLCDGIMASECDVVTHTIPALQPIVHDLFVLRGNMKHDSTSDLDTQREVIQSMLFRIIEHPEVLTMVTTILQYYRKENPDQWKRYSRQVTDVILPLMSHLKLDVWKYSEMSYLHSLFEALSPSALRPIDLVLNIFFLLPTDLRTVSLHSRWLMKTLSLLRVLLCHLKEDYILLRIKEMQIDPQAVSCQRLTSLICGEGENTAASSNTGQKTKNSSVTPEGILSRTFVQLIGVTVDRLVGELFEPARSRGNACDSELLAHLLCEFLLTITYICRSGSFKQVTKAIRATLSDGDDKNGVFFQSGQICYGFNLLAQHQPVVTLLWSQLLTCVGFMELPLWGRLTGKYDKDQEAFTCRLLLNRGMVHRGSIIMLADYICQNQSEVELMSWLIVNHTSDIVSLQREPPIQDFISAIHRSPPGSGLFIESVRTLLSEEKMLKLAFKKQILYSLRGLHLDQSDALLVLLLNDWFVFSPMLTVSEFSSRVACDRVEMLLSQTLDGDRKDAVLQRVRSIQTQVDRCRTVLRLGRLRVLMHRLLCTLTGEQSASDPSTDQGVEIVDPDKAWYKSIASQFCLRRRKSYEVAQVLSVLDHGDIADIVKNDKFSFSHIEECIAFGVSEMVHPDNASTLYAADSTSPLLKATLETLTSKLDAFLALFPPAPNIDFIANFDQAVFEMGRRSPVAEYWDKIFHLFGSEANREIVVLLCRSFTRALMWQKLIAHPFETLGSLDKKLFRLVVCCYELITWCMLNGVVPTCHTVLVCLECMQQVLQKPEVQTIFSENESLFHVLTVANCLHSIVSMFSGDLQVEQDTDGMNGDESLSVYAALNNNSIPVMVVMKACQVMQRYYNDETDAVPSALLHPMEFALRQVLCHPFFNSLARIPASLFKSEMKEQELEGLSKESPGEYLQDKDMLKEFVERINNLGWISRMQFEETWTSLLGVLVSQPIGDGSQNASPVDENAIQISCLTISALTSLVVNTSMKPQGGQPTTGSYQTIPRTSSAKNPLTKVEHELHAIHCIIEGELRDALFGDQLNQTFQYNQLASNCLSFSDLTPTTPDVLRSLLSFNLERRERDPLYYGMGQRSVRSFQAVYGISPVDEDVSQISSEDEENQATISSSDESDDDDVVDAATPKNDVDVPPLRSNPVQPQSVDAHSCVQFMIDLFSEWFHSASKASVTGMSANNLPVYTLKLPRQFLCECLHSLLLISDFFTERQQFEWMFTSLNSLQMVQPCEDDIMLQYLVLGMCKAGAVLGLGKKVCEIITPMIEAAFACAVPSCHVFAMQGALYVLECEPKEYMRPLLQLLSRFVCDRFKSVNLVINLHSDQALRHVVAVGFYLIENCSTFIQSSHSSTFIQGAISILSRSEGVPDDLYVMLVKSLESLVTSYSVSSVDCEAIAKLAMDQFSNSRSVVRMLVTLRMAVTCMYYRIMRVSETNATEEEALEARLLSMERITLLFDRIRGGNPQEARLLIQVLPRLLDTFFSMQDRMNKVIGEFVSNLHPFPDLIATVLHSVFQMLHNRGETDLIQSWVMLSLGNFTQRTPISAAVWCLTCIFVSASTNHWVNSLLPIVLSELHTHGTDLDYQKFYVSASDFYDNLSADLDRRTFHSIFKGVSESGIPYQKLLDIIGAP